MLDHRLEVRVRVLAAFVFVLLLALPFLNNLGISWELSYPKLFALQAAVAVAWAGLLVLRPDPLGETMGASGMGLPMLAFVGWAGLSAVWSGFPWMAGQPGIELGFAMAAVVGLANLFSDRRSRGRFVLLYGLSAGAAAVVYVLHYAAAPDHMRVYPFANPSVAALFMIGPMAVGASFALSSVMRRTRWWKGLLGAAVAVVCGWALVRSRSTAGTASGAVALFLVLLFTLRGRSRRLLPAVVLVVVVVVMAWPVTVPGLWPGAEFIEGLGPRAGLWRGTGRLINERPLAGHGAGTFVVEFSRVSPREFAAHRHYASVVENAHSFPLHVLAELGIVGLGLIVWLLYRAARNVRTAERQVDSGERALLLGLVCGGIGMVGQGLGCTAVHQPGAYVNLILVFALIAGMARMSGMHRPAAARPSAAAGFVLGLGALAIFVLTAGPNLVSQYEMREGFATPADQYTERLGHLRRSVELWAPTPRTLRARIEMALTYQRSGHVGQAVEQLDAVNELAPNFGRIQVARTQMLLELGELGPATDAVIIYCEKDPFDSATYRLWAEIVRATPPELRAEVARPDVALRYLEIAGRYVSPRLPPDRIEMLREPFLEAMREPDGGQ